jgi:hypothetical protein
MESQYICGTFSMDLMSILELLAPLLGGKQHTEGLAIISMPSSSSFHFHYGLLVRK